MSLSDIWSLLLLVVVVVGIAGRRRFSKRAKLWLWRTRFNLVFLVDLEVLQEQK